MISHARFGALRLVQFLPDAEIAELENWEFMDHLWLGEAVGFCEWLRLENEPDVLRSLAIDFTEFPEQAAADLVEFGSGAYQRRSEQTSRLLGQLAERLQGEDFAMAFTMEDFNRQYIKEHFPQLTPAEREEVLRSLPPEERLAGLPPEERLAGLPPEQRLAGLSAEQIRQYLARLSPKRPASSRKPRRKK